MSMYGFPLTLLFLTVAAHVIDNQKSDFNVRYNEDVANENDETSDWSDEAAEFLLIVQEIKDDNPDTRNIYTDDRQSISPSKTDFLEKSMKTFTHEMELENVDVKDEEFNMEEKVAAEISIPPEQIAYGRKRRATEDQKLTKQRHERISNRYKKGRQLLEHAKTRRNFHLRQVSARTKPVEWRKEKIRGKVRRKHLRSEEKENGAKSLFRSKENGHNIEKPISREGKGHSSENVLQRKRRDTDVQSSDGIRRYYGRSRKCNMAWRQARDALESCGAKLNTLSTRDGTTKRKEAEGQNTETGIWAGKPNPSKSEEDETREKESVPESKAPPVGDKEGENRKNNNEGKSEYPKTNDERETNGPEDSESGKGNGETSY